jgi:membrane-associated protein
MTIVLARFVPIVRTFAPFVAGLGRMRYLEFAIYNVAGGCLWVGLFVTAGRLFGNLPIVKQYFSLVIAAIIIISVLPILYEIWRQWQDTKKKAS